MITIDFNGVKQTITELKRQLREEPNYGNHQLLLRSKDDNFVSGEFKGLFNWSYVSGDYNNTIVTGIKEYVPKGISKDYAGLAVNPDADIKFSVEHISGYIINNTIENDGEVWIDFLTDVSGNVVTEGDLPSGAKKCELVSYQDDMFSIERIFWLNVSEETI